MTVITLDLDGVKTMQIVTKTESAAMLSVGDLQAMLDLTSSTIRPPTRKRRLE